MITEVARRIACVEYTYEEAAEAGAFVEDALSEEDAIASDEGGAGGVASDVSARVAPKAVS